MNKNWQATSAIARDLRRFLRPQTHEQKTELRKQILAMMERQLRAIN
jgi:hypothetical protein